MVDIDSDEQSNAANWIEVHQEPCLHVFLAAMNHTGVPELHYSLGDSLEELAEHASNIYMFDYDLSVPYFNWITSLFFYLKRRKDVLDELEKIYTEKRVESNTKTDKENEIIQESQKDVL
jgi:hypothetical protein